ncbi:MAG: BTAD domain-containing putative transcriptional regulator [Caldilineaceae bacterium]
MLHIKLLGTPAIYLDSPPDLRFRTRKAQALLIYLAVTARSWSRDSLATLFWPETDDASARKNLRDILPSLRRQLGDYLLLDEDVIGLTAVKPYFCDVTTFSQGLEQPLKHIETQHLVDILALYRGEFLEGFATSRISTDFELWALREREWLHQLALMGFTTLCRRQQETGSYETALTTNRQLLKLAPWDEAAHRRQMLLLAQSGQPAAALAHYDACRQILADELDAEPATETVALYEQIKAGQHYAKPSANEGSTRFLVAPAAQAAPHNLPRQLTSLVGREDDIAAVVRLLTEEHIALLTLVGQGGVGKTRLALAVAQQLRQHTSGLFPAGIWFVPLAGIAPDEQAKEQMAGAIAQAMGLSLTGADPLAKQIIRALQEQQLLLVLDNFEHLVAEQAFLLEIVQTAQHVKVLITSRSQLHLHAEYLYPVTGLPAPAASDLRQDEHLALLLVRNPEQAQRPQLPVDLGQFESVQLFVSRVQQRLPEFHLSAQNQQNIGRICHLLGGVPLGIELAAQLYVEQGHMVLTRLIGEIEQLDPLERLMQSDPTGLDYLQTPAIDLPPRQRSIRAVFLHSWRLLTAAEQDLLRHCAIFRGGFSREAILTVAAGDGTSLLALVMKSLVRRDSHDRYDLHELIRQYVIDQLQQDPLVVHAAAQKHAAYFTAFLAGQEEKLLQQITFHQTIQIEIYNIRAAWAWCVDQTALAALESCVVCLFIYLRYAGQVHAAITLATQAIQRLRSLGSGERLDRSHDRLLGFLLIYAASAGIGAGLMQESAAWLQEAQAIGEMLADPALLAQIYATLMIKASLDLEVQMMTLYAQQAFHWVKAAHAPHLQPVIFRVHSIGLARQGKIDESFQVAAELQQLIQSRHYHCVEGESFYLTSTLYEIQKDWEAALTAAQQGQTLCQARGHMFGFDNLEGNMIWANLQLGNFAQACELAQGFGERARRTGKQAELLYSLQSLGQAEMGLGHWQASAAYLTEALKLAVAIKSNVRQVLICYQLGKLSICQAAYDQALVHFQDALQCAKSAELLGLQTLAQAGLALTHLRQGQPTQALTEVESLLAAAKAITPDSPDYCSIRLTIYQVLTAQQDPRADAILAQLYQEVQTQAAKIKNDTQRATFLENIPEHRDIVALWQKHDADGI